MGNILKNEREASKRWQVKAKFSSIKAKFSSILRENSISLIATASARIIAPLGK